MMLQGFHHIVTQVKIRYNLGIHAILQSVFGFSDLNFTRILMNFFIRSPQGGNLGELFMGLIC